MRVLFFFYNYTMKFSSQIKSTNFSGQLEELPRYSGKLIMPPTVNGNLKVMRINMRKNIPA